jgi:hypothetical protein
MGLFSFSRRRKRSQRGASAADISSAAAGALGALGRTLVAARLRGEAVPGDCVQLVFSAGGQARRVAAASAREGEIAYCFHPGPYCVDVVPFAAAPELGLRTRFVIDAADPRAAQQRFDLYLFSEVADALTVADLCAAIERAIQGGLEQGTLDLPPCAALDEWNVFRAGLNQLLYTRFGITVDDCIPVDLGEQADFAATLRARAQAPAAIAAIAATVVTAAQSTPADAGAEPMAALAPVEHFAPAAADARALRRLFLELPVLTSGLRMVTLPAGQAVFVAQRSLLQRLALIALDVNTMPSLAWVAPDQPLAADQQRRRARHSILAAQALDQAWALLARWRQGMPDAAADPVRLDALLDEADRIVSNLDYHLAQRRIAHAVEAQAATVIHADTPPANRREPYL